MPDMRDNDPIPTGGHTLLMSKFKQELDKKFLQDLLKLDLSHIPDKILQSAISPELMNNLKQMEKADPQRKELVKAARSAIEAAATNASIKKTNKKKNK